jgi:hypothetical protein
MPSKKPSQPPAAEKPSKKAAAKKKVAAKKTAKKTAKPAAKKPAAKKPAAKKTVKTVAKPSKSTPAKRAPTGKPKPIRQAAVPEVPLPEGVTQVTVSVLQIANISPVDLTVLDVRGTPYVFYLGTQIDDEIDDVFDSTTTDTSVNWILTNNAGYTVDVTFGTGASSPLANNGSTTYPMSMPAAGACNSTTLLVGRDGQLAHDPVIKIKRKDTNGRIPSC